MMQSNIFMQVPFVVEVPETLDCQLRNQIRQDPEAVFNKHYGYHPLFIAAVQGWLGLAQLIIETLDTHFKEAKTGHLDYRDPFGRTALHYAAIMGRTNIVELLLKTGTDPSIMDIYNFTALDWEEKICSECSFTRQQNKTLLKNAMNQRKWRIALEQYLNSHPRHQPRQTCCPYISPSYIYAYLKSKYHWLRYG